MIQCICCEDWLHSRVCRLRDQVLNRLGVANFLTRWGYVPPITLLCLSLDNLSARRKVDDRINSDSLNHVIL